jgi:hypothetical protein
VLLFATRPRERTATDDKKACLFGCTLSTKTKSLSLQVATGVRERYFFLTEVSMVDNKVLVLSYCMPAKIKSSLLQYYEYVQYPYLYWLSAPRTRERTNCQFTSEYPYVQVCTRREDECRSSKKKTMRVEDKKACLFGCTPSTKTKLMPAKIKRRVVWYYYKPITSLVVPGRRFLLKPGYGRQ